MMTEANLTRLVSKLTRMRGAALKVGQFLSIQGPPRLLHSHPARAYLALHRHTRAPTRTRPRLPPRTGLRALHAQLADGGLHRVLPPPPPPLLHALTWRVAGRDGVFTWTRVAFFLYGF
jgi:hypothetical protein